MKVPVPSIRSIMTPHPGRDWFVALLIVVLIGLGLAGVALYYFIGLESGAIASEGVGATTPTPSVSRADLEKVLTLYKTRALNYQSGNIRTPNVSDPAK